LGNRTRAAICAMAIALASEGACGMSTPTGKLSHCHVIAGDKLPAETGGEEAICIAIAQALQSGAANAAVEVSVISPYLLSATVTLADGRKLPAIKVGSADRPLGTRAVRMLADSIAAQTASQQKQN
jgi:hypothetical protein